MHLRPRAGEPNSTLQGPASFGAALENGNTVEGTRSLGWSVVPFFGGWHITKKCQKKDCNDRAHLCNEEQQQTATSVLCEEDSFKDLYKSLMLW